MRSERTHLVEVDVHTLKLEIRGPVVPGRGLRYGFGKISNATYTPEPSRPCSPEMVCLIRVRL